MAVQAVRAVRRRSTRGAPPRRRRLWRRRRGAGSPAADRHTDGVAAWRAADDGAPQSRMDSLHDESAIFQRE